MIEVTAYRWGLKNGYDPLYVGTGLKFYQGEFWMVFKYRYLLESRRWVFDVTYPDPINNRECDYRYIMDHDREDPEEKLGELLSAVRRLYDHLKGVASRAKRQKVVI